MNNYDILINTIETLRTSQGFFSGGYGWEDLASYPMGYRQANRHAARQQAKKTCKSTKKAESGLIEL